MTTCSGFLLRVGIEGKTGGIYGPIYPGRSFEFIPIPETQLPNDCLNVGVLKQTRMNRYCQLPLRHPYKSLRRLSDLLPVDYLMFRDNSHNIRVDYCIAPKLIPHDDPDFQHKTFGDYWGMIPKDRLGLESYERDMLAQRGYVDLRSSIYVFFVTSLWSTQRRWYSRNRPTYRQLKDEQQEKMRRSMYLTGYFSLEKIVDVGKLEGYENTLRVFRNNAEVRRRLQGNFHFKRHGLVDRSGKSMPKFDSNVVILFGRPNRSKLLDHAIPLRKSSTLSEPNRLGNQLGLKVGDPMMGPRPLSGSQCKIALEAIRRLG
ncbi:MAG: hypothetical protein WB643_11365 [Candidatus Bathyarchaeia archaeon]